MSKIIDDFVNAGQKLRPCVFFDGDRKAAEISARISKNQRRKFKRHQIVPPAVYVYLRESGILKKDAKTPQGGTTVGELLDFLRWYPYETEQARSDGEYLFREIIKGDVPFLSKAFASSDHLWAKRETYGELKGNKGKKLTFLQN